MANCVLCGSAKVGTKPVCESCRVGQITRKIALEIFWDEEDEDARRMKRADLKIAFNAVQAQRMTYEEYKTHIKEIIKRSYVWSDWV
jgi:hypothetical protein